MTVDVDAFLRDRREALQFAGIILAGTAARPAQFGCFGLHEWAMVYRQDKFDLRHEYLQLRLGPGRTDEVVEENRIRCSHFDAFRFYTPDAVPLNSLVPSRENQRAMEQPGCLHANMDLYKWAYKLSPLLPGELVMDCFELSWRIRAMDMRASPVRPRRLGIPRHPDRDAGGQGRVRGLSAGVRGRVAAAPGAAAAGTGAAAQRRGHVRFRHRRPAPDAGHEPEGPIMTDDSQPRMHARNGVDLTICLTEAPGAPEYTFRLVAGDGAPSAASTLPDPAAALEAVRRHGEAIFFPNRGRRGCARSSTAARRPPS